MSKKRLSEQDRLILSLKAFKEELSEVQDERGVICVWLDALVLDILVLCRLEDRAGEVLSAESLDVLRSAGEG